MLSLHSLHSRGTCKERSIPSSASKMYNAWYNSSTGLRTRIVADMQMGNVPLGKPYATDKHGREIG